MGKSSSGHSYSTPLSIIPLIPEGGRQVSPGFTTAGMERTPGPRGAVETIHAPDVWRGSLASLEESPASRQRRWTAFGVSCLLQPLGVGLAAWLLVAVAPRVQAPERQRLYFKLTFSKPPIAQAPALPPPKRPQSHPIVAALPPPVAHLPEAPRVRPVPQPPETLASKPQAPKAPNPPMSETPKPEVVANRTDIFSGSSAKPTLRLPRREVQTGGFGDASGIPQEADSSGRGEFPRLGSFDLPVGPGNGNGSGGAHGARGTVASAGFGNGIAGSGGPARRGGTVVHEGGFGEVETADRKASKEPRRDAPAAAPFEPLEILSKPNPVYTEEARRLHVQGEVVLEVVFAAAGQLRVRRVIRGLGHGLDEAAVRAAEQMAFKPAKRGGEPVDFTATLRVIFQLAN